LPGSYRNTRFALVPASVRLAGIVVSCCFPK
jgi:hypothetical protein